jgi:hypothetical protein
MFREIGLVTLVTCVIAVLAALVGGAVVVWGSPGALSFDTYLKDMAGFVAGLGIVGVGRGIHLGQRARAVGETRRTRAHV